MVQQKPIDALEPVMMQGVTWCYAYEDEDSGNFFHALIADVFGGWGARTVFIHAHCEDGKWCIWPVFGRDDEYQRLWFDSHEPAEEHVQQTFRRVLRGCKQ